MSKYFPYCVRCLEQPNAKTKDFYDFRFEEPVCLSCVELYDLEPDENGYVEEDN